MKKLLSIIATVALVIGLLPSGAVAWEADPQDSAPAEKETLRDSADERASALTTASSQSLEVALSAQAAGDSSQATPRDEQRLGIGGGGALFDPAVSPFNANDMAVGTDMGDIYVTRDGGGSWAKKTVGRAYDIQYDPTREGTVYACGSGIWRSTDFGQSFELMWPKRNHVTGEPTKYENSRYYFFNTDGYDPYSQVVSIAVDRANNDNLYALATKSKQFILYRSTDGGDTFVEIAERAFDLRGIDGSRHDNSKLLVNDGTVWLCTQAGIFKYDGSTTLVPVYEPDGASRYCVIDVAQVVEGSTTYWRCDRRRRPHSRSSCPRGLNRARRSGASPEGLIGRPGGVCGGGRRYCARTLRPQPRSPFWSFAGGPDWEDSVRFAAENATTALECFRKKTSDLGKCQFAFALSAQ